MLCGALKPCLDPRLVLGADALGHHTAISLPFHFECGTRNVRRRLAVDALRLERTMIDAGFQALLCQGGIRSHRPTLAHMQQLVDRRSETGLATSCVAPFEGGFGAQSRRRGLARRCEQVRVKIARIAARIIPRRMNRDIERESITLDQLPRKSRDQIDSRLRR